jgi:hypothetical protein
MGSSVLSERAFLLASITISKCRNWLQGNIVEALQFIKCLLHTDLIFHEPQPLSILKDELEGVVEDDNDPNWEDEDPSGWDDLFISENSDDED